MGPAAALQLSFINPTDVILGDLHKNVCWLQSPMSYMPPLSISILGFVGTVYMKPMHARRYLNNKWAPNTLSTLASFLGKVQDLGGDDRDRATVQTDLFIWALLVYELSTGGWLADGKALVEVEAMMTHRLWPKLDEGGLYEIVKHWPAGNGHVDAEEVKKELGKSLMGKRWDVAENVAS